MTAKEYRAECERIREQAKRASDIILKALIARNCLAVPIHQTYTEFARSIAEDITIEIFTFPEYPTPRRKKLVAWQLERKMKERRKR